MKFRFVFYAFCIWRVFLFQPLAISTVIPYKANQEYTQILRVNSQKIARERLLLSPLVYPWANFDGVHYLDIAANGYKNNGRFFPFFPVAIHLLSLGAQQNTTLQFLVAFFISNFSFFISLILLYKLVKKQFDEKIAFWSCIFLMVFPTSFFFVSIYSEGLFLLLILLSFYFADRKSFLLAGAFAGLSALTRPVGIVMFPVLLYMTYRSYRSHMTYRILYPFLVPLFLSVFALYCYFRWQDPLYFIHAQGLLSNGRSVSSFVFPFQTVYRYFKILTSVSSHVYEWWVALLEIICFLIASTLLVIAWIKKIRFEYLFFATSAFLLPSSSGTFSGLPRYILILFPIFIVLGTMQSKLLRIVYITFSLTLTFILLLLFSRGYFIA